MSETPKSGAEALGESPAFLAFQEKLRLVAPIERPVIIVGERGTGKELAARRLHFSSKRWAEPLVTLNCAAIAPTLVESELFGYEAGAFTGAQRRRAGRFEAANGGTLFLDELGQLPREVQAKLLRVLEYGEFERVGGHEPVRVNVRIIAATNADLPRMVAEGAFQADLLDRLSFAVLALPPLRERREDIPLLAEHFAARMSAELGRAEPPALAAPLIETLLHYAWPGNIRELKNVIERAVAQAEDPTLKSVELEPFGKQAPSSETTPNDPPPRTGATMDIDPTKKSLSEAIAELETAYLRAALQAEQWHQQKAAARLGLSYHQFRGLFRKHKEALE